MTQDTRLDGLLSVYDRAPRDAKPAAEELCAACPELLDEVRRRLGAMNAADGLLGDDAAGPAAGAPPEAKPAGRSAPGETAAPPDRIGSYHIVQLLGEGGMGSVYRAEQRSTIRRTVAIKLVKPGFDSQEVIARFDSERQALARMDHPSIARVLDGGTSESGRPYFVMEYVPGRPITQFADDERLTLRQRLELFIDVCEAIAHAHAKAVIHRDIKPGNVLAFMQDARPRVKVIDFGVAKALTGDRLTDATMVTRSGSAIGTYEYMSPEQADSSPDVDTRSDIYSLGVLLYELLSGVRPLDRAKMAAAGEQELLRTIRDSVPPRASDRLLAAGPGTVVRAAECRGMKIEQLMRQLRSELEWIPAKAMRRERDRRYTSAQQMADDIGNYLAGRSLIAGPETRSYQIKKFLARHRSTVLVAVAFTVVVVAAVAFYIHLIRAEEFKVQAAKDELTVVNQQLNGSLTESQEQRQRADQNATEAQEQKRRAELQVAHGLVAEGNALTAASRFVDARTRITDAYRSYVRLGVSPFEAELGLWKVNACAPPMLMSLVGHSDSVNGVAISPDCRTAMSAGADHTLIVWDVVTGRELTVLAEHKDSVRDVAISPGGDLAVSASADHTLIVWDLKKCRKLRTLTGHSDEVTAVAISPDGSFAASASLDNTLKIWDLATGNQVRTLEGHTDKVTGVTFTPDGSQIISASRDQTLKVWETSTGHLVKPLEGHAGEVAGVASDGRTVIGASWDNTIKLWDMGSTQIVRTLGSHSDFVTGIRMSDDGNTVITGSWDGSIRAWTLDSDSSQLFVGHTAEVNGIAIGSDRRMLLSASSDNTIGLWDLAGEPEVGTLGVSVGHRMAGVDPAHTQWVTSVAMDDRGRLAVSGSADETAIVWDLPTRHPLLTLRGHTDAINGVAISGDGRTVATASDDKSLKVWKLPADHEAFTLDGNEDAIKAVTMSRDGKTIISGGAAGAKGTVKIWNALAGNSPRNLNPVPAAANAVSLTSDGRYILAGCDDGTVAEYNFETGEQIHAWASIGSVTSVAVAADDRTLISGADNKVKLWDLQAGGTPRAFAGLTSGNRQVNAVAITPDGKTAFSGSADRILKVWDVPSGREIQNFVDHGDWILGMALSPDSRLLLTASRDGTVKVYDFSRATTYLDFEPRLAAARQALAHQPSDPGALSVLGEWYAFRGRNDWAVELLEKSRAGGGGVSPLLLGRCYWKLNNLPLAKREFESALANAGNDDDRFYLNLCLTAIIREGKK